MVTIEAHNLTFPNPETELEMVERQIQKSPEKIAQIPKNVGVAFDRSLRLLGFRAFLSKPSEDILKALNSARDFAVGLFARGSATPDETVRFTISGEPIEVVGGTSEFNTAPRWISAFGIGLILRDQDTLDKLCRYNLIDFEGSYDHYHIALATALMAAHNNSNETNAVFEAALDQALNAKDSTEWGKRVGAPLVRLARAVFNQETEGLDDRVMEALEGYKAMYSRKSESHLAEAYIPVAHLGLCAMAWDRGIRISVSSPYLPDWLVKGEIT